MCIIAYCRKRRLSEAEIEKCWRDNPDGAGVAWTEGQNVCYIKGMQTVNEMVYVLNDERIKLPYVAHFRLATSGTKSMLLTHPFLISPNSPLQIEYKGPASVLFHNGHWTEADEKLLTYCITHNIKIPDGIFSDSRIIAIFARYLGENFLSLISGKFVVVSPRNKIKFYGNFEETDGIMFSNGFVNGYTGYSTRYFNHYGSIKQWNFKDDKNNDVLLDNS